MIEQALEKIAKDLKNCLYWLRHDEAVKVHQGEFKESDLKEIALTAPCVRFTYNGLSDITQMSGAQLKARLDLVAILITKNCELRIGNKTEVTELLTMDKNVTQIEKAFYNKDQIITMMLDHLIPFITANSFNLAGMDNSRKLQARPLCRGESSGVNIAIWTASWSHEFIFQTLAGQPDQAENLRNGNWEDLKGKIS